MFSAPGTLQTQISSLEDEMLSLNKLHQERMHEGFSDPHRSIGRYLDLLSAKFLTGTLEIFLKVDQRFASSLARKISKLCFDREKFTPN